MEILENAISQVDIKGIKLYPPLHYYHAYEDRIIPYYEVAQDNDLLVTFHFGISVGNTADIRFMNPADLSPIARDFNKIKFLMAHFATGYLRELLFLMYHVENIYAETSSSNAWMKYVPYDITLAQVFRKVIDARGVDHLVFGTDSSFLPRGWRKSIYDLQLAVCNTLELNQEEIDKIFYKNLKKLLGL
jgi:predicted TIM-barrel fold metal-dependent hydrolase